MSRMKARMTLDNALRISGERSKPCAACGSVFKPKRKWQECCCRECQLVYLAARTILDAYRAGRANGLKKIIEEMKGE